MTKSNRFEKRAHIGIFELDTEEESILTLFSLFKHCGYKVSLFLSPKIWNLIKNSIHVNDIELLMVFEEGNTFIDVHESIEELIDGNKIDLVIVPRFRSISYRETKKYIEFFNEYKVAVKILTHDRWLKMFPPLRFNGIKIIKRGAILDWLYCHLVFKHISAYFMSEIHRYSDNPLKEIIQRKTSKRVLDFPFKLMDGDYNPDTAYDFPIFVIPGKIEKERRDYIKVLNIFSNPSLKKYEWKLILLGRPIGNYGKKVLKIADNINLSMGKNRVEYIKEYISKDEFDRSMNKATHILAPVTKDMYKLGKDSGALYDVFKYNKIGIFDDAYFYNKDLIEKKVVLMFTNENDLKSLLFNIITNKYSYGHITNHFRELSSYLEKRKYIDYARTEIASLL